MKTIIKITLVSLLLGSFSLLAACNTFAGMGEDAQKGGQDLQNAADRNK